MTDPTTPFDGGPDPVLGAALRAALAPRDHAAFVARVMAAAERLPNPLVSVLARWARLGIAAALLAALAAGFAVGRGGLSVEATTAGADAGAVIAGVQAPDATTLLASFPER